MGLVYFILALVAHAVGGMWWQFAVALIASFIVELVYMIFTGTVGKYDVISREDAARIYDIDEWKEENAHELGEKKGD